MHALLRSSAAAFISLALWACGTSAPPDASGTQSDDGGSSAAYDASTSYADATGQSWEAGDGDASDQASDAGNGEGGEGGSYAWRNVVIGGGGWITGLVRDDSSGDLYARADVGGLYRWDTDHWLPLLDFVQFPVANEYGGQSVALSPSYATDHTLYVASGEYDVAPHDIFKSTDRGLTWAASDMPVVMVGNGDGRWCGERLAVDPNDPDLVYFGAPNAGGAGDAGADSAGLWVSRAASAPGSWSRVSSFPVTGDAAEGLSFVLLDPATTTSTDAGTVSETIYVGVVDSSGATSGVYRSQNAGATWSRLAGTTHTSPCRAAIASDGTLYVDFRHDPSGPGGVAKMARNGTGLTEIDLAGAPSNAGYYALAVDPSDPQTVYTTQSEGTITRPNVMQVTHNGGTTWAPLPYATPLPATIAITQNQYTWFAGPAAMVINPSNVNEAWLSDGFGVMHTTELTSAAAPTWDSQVTGIEEIVVDDLLSLPTGSVPLLSGASDVGGFIHTSLTSPPTSRLPDDSEAIHYDFCRSDPSVVVYTGHYYTAANEFAPYIGATSADAGLSFHSVATPGSGNGGGRIAVSPTDCGHWVLQQFDGSMWVTTNGGASWTQSQGAPVVQTLSGTNIHNDTVYQQQLATDEVTGVFYVATVTPPTVSPLSPGSATIYSSSDGTTWSEVGSLSFPPITATEARSLGYANIQWHYSLRTTPGHSGDMWLAVAGVGVYHSTDGGVSFQKVPALTSSGLLALGVPPAGSTTPTVFVHTASGDFLRSDDLGTSWLSIDDPNEPVGDRPEIMEADRQVWGRVFVGTNGRGIFVGGPQ